MKLQHRRNVIRFKSIIAGNGRSNIVKGGRCDCNDKRLEATAWKFTQLNGKLCIYDDIKFYLKATKIIHGRRDDFLSINYRFKKGDINYFFENQNLGEQALPKYIRQFCEKLDISAERLRDSFPMHGLRAKPITNRFEAGLWEESISMKSGHRQTQYLK